MEEIKYRREDEMKDSGIEWLGKIPKEWGVTKLKYELKNFESGKREPFYEEEVLSIGGEHILNGKFNLQNPRYVSYKFYRDSNQGKIKENDILLVKDGATIGKAMYVNKLDFDAMVNEHVYRLEYSKYGYYVILSNSTQKQFWMKNNSTAQESINSNTLKNIDIVKNSKEEQQKIANFLDYKTSQFDSIISKKEKLIEKLEEAKKSLISEVITGKIKIVDGEMVERKPEEMKDSGVEWLGMIPKDWEVKRLKYLASKISKGTTPSTIGKEILEEGPVRFLKAENIVDNKVSLTPECFIDNSTNKILSRSALKAQDILFVIAGATIGKLAILNEELCPANTNQAVSFIRLKNIENSKFVFYWLQSSNLRRHMWSLTVQAAQPNLSLEDLGNFYLPYPNISERTDIVNFLEIKTKGLDNIINKTKTQIQKLKEAKESLISEAVTGKIDLRDWEIREVDES
ncbi:MAG: hypothetical protein GX080_00840 [Tissierellia bacterium]|nr:hypothetical protein [Tissierellia bacterium]